MFTLARLRVAALRRSLWGLSALLASAACSHELPPPQQTPANTAPLNSANPRVASAPPATEPATSAHTAGAVAQTSNTLGQPTTLTSPELPSIAGLRCYTPAQVEQDADLLRGVRYRTSGELSVVRVVPGDTLHLRASPEPGAASLAELAFDARRIRPQGSICTGRGSPWFEVEVGDRRGWVNSQFVDYSTPSRDASAEYASLLEGLSNSSHEILLSAIEDKLRKRHADMGPDPNVTRVGSRVSGASHSTLIETCCFGDDSVRGEQVAIELLERDGRFRLVKASSRTLCYRGEAEGLCL